jgi:phosphatidylglycerol---prolipoprotein diacylglyceryl transferase
MQSVSGLASIAYPNIDPIALRVGPFAVHWYGLAYLVGFIGAALIMRWLARRWELGLSDDDLMTVLLGCIVGVIVGARVGYVLVYGGDFYLRHPAEVLAIWDGGMSFHGGLVGVLLAGVVLSRVLKMSWLTLCDMGAVGAPIGFGLGRLTNFINNELWGRTTTVPWGIVFPGAGPLPRHPSQLYEATLEGLVLLVAMLLLARKLPPRPRGELLGWFLAGYGLFRITAEFFRQPDLQIGFVAGGVTMGQILSVPMVLVGISLVVWARRSKLPQQGPAPR